jgi:UDP-GlcNAc:undecaprenyl-phosphate/decaprenyl-phosphate GlcNAc-1-phosphate transferase
MKRIWTVGLALGLFACSVGAQEAPAIKTQKDKLSYAIGIEMGKGVKAQGLDIDLTLMFAGLKDAISGAKPLMSDADLNTIITGLQEEIRQKQMQAMEEQASDNKKQGEAFLAENTKKEGVVTLPSGLQYKVITAGQGKKPVESDTVMCNYRGTFLDGTEFDSSAQAGKPVPFEVKSIIPGIKEALLLMPVGSKWQVVIPSNLAYGDHGAANVIGPNATLIFELELVSIQSNP